MRVLFVIQRYGADLSGGAEALCRELATRLARYGDDVEVLTSRARDYLTWADSFPPGDTSDEGVLVHRLGVAAPRDIEKFGPLDGRVAWGRRRTPMFLQEAWMRAQGPGLLGFESWLHDHAPRFDVAVFFTYLYRTTRDGLRATASSVPSVLQATAHDEPHFWLPLFDTVLRQPTMYAFATEEEQTLLQRRTSGRARGMLTRIGIEPGGEGDAARFRSAFGLDDRPYLLYVGRLDEAKGALELFAYFDAFKRRHHTPLVLVVVGDNPTSMPVPPDVVLTGFVDEQTKNDAYEGCLAVALPSYFESFSMTLAEGWARSRPALVQARCAVTAGQTRR
ncbi:MAG: glycosyltransferase family 4 protein, partial [Acidimicrobiaceae bacterium]|nr:glycosyltransferase family 4 protein [Acidimicrobiaceae bacterium]